MEFVMEKDMPRILSTRVSMEQSKLIKKDEEEENEEVSVIDIESQT